MITPKLLRKWRACWSDDKIKRYFASKDWHNLTPREIALDDAVPRHDRVWVLAHTMAHIDPSSARLFVITLAQEVVEKARLGDDESTLLGALNDLIQIEDSTADDQPAGRAAVYRALCASNPGATDPTSNAVFAAVRLSCMHSILTSTGLHVWNAAMDLGRADYLVTQRTYPDAISAVVSRALEWLGPYADRRAL